MQLLFAILGILFIVLGSGIGLMGLIWHLIEAFKTSTGWGVGCLAGAFCLCYIPNLIWLIMNWAEGWRPVVIMLFGGILPGAIGWILYMSSQVPAS